MGNRLVVFPAGQAAEAQAEAHREAVRLGKESARLGRKGPRVFETAMSATELAELAEDPSLTVEYRDGRPSTGVSSGSGRSGLRRVVSRLARIGRSLRRGLSGGGA